MAGDGATANYGWILPDPGGAVSTWGISLNSNLNSIDGHVKTNEVAIAGIKAQITATSMLITRGPDGGPYGVINFYNQAGSQPRWIMYETSEAESGSAAGTNFGFNAYNNDGSFAGTVFTVNRAARRMVLSQDPVNATDAVTKQYSDMGMVPIGGIIMWPSATLPPRFTWCLGQHLNATQYPQLFNVIGGTFFWDGTNFGLPNVGGRMAVGYDGSSWGMGGSGGEVNHTLTSSEMPVHNHAASQDAHTHYVYQDVHTHADSGHVHGASASQDTHSHGGVITGAQAGSVFQIGATGTLTSGRTDNQTPAVHISISTDYAHLDNRQPSVYADNRQPNVTVGYSGSGTTHNNMPPYLVLGFIIRFA